MTSLELSRLVFVHDLPEWALRGGRLKPEKVDISGLRLFADNGSMKVYVSDDLEKEMNEARRDARYGAVGLFHATNSGAFEGIKKHKAILSAKKLVEIGEVILTGEYSQPIGDYHRSQGGLGSVYVSQSSHSDTYCFGQTGESVNGSYETIFGIDKNAYSHLPPYQLVDDGDGIRIGEKIDLDDIKTMTVPFSRIGEARRWANSTFYEPPLVFSWDAARLLSYKKHGY